MSGKKLRDNTKNDGVRKRSTYKRLLRERELSDNTFKAWRQIREKEEALYQLRQNIKEQSICPHDVGIEHYFDVSSGLRASDKGHSAAVKCYERITPMLRAEDTFEVAKEGFIVAEETRKMMAELLGCKPRNIFFGNSATRTLIPIFLSLSKKGWHNLVVTADDYRAVGGLVNAEEETFHKTVTRQNFGEAQENKHLRNFNDASTMKTLANDFKLSMCSLEMGDFHRKTGSSVHNRYPSVLYCSHLNRESGGSWMGSMNEVLKTLRMEHPDSFLIVDASHSAGTVKLDAPALGDVVMMNSSKILGGEPALGICYVSDCILKLMEEELPSTKWPKIAFQFCPKTQLGVRSAEDAVHSRHWISIPELFSLHAAIENIDMEARTRKLQQLRSYFEGMLDFFDSYPGLRITTMKGGPNFLPIMVAMEPKKLPTNDRLVSCLADIGELDDEYLVRRLIELHLEERIRPLAEKIRPYTITSEFPGDKRFRGGSLGGGYPLNIITPFLRISWSDDHTIDNAKGLCRKIAQVLDESFGSSFLQHIDEVENYLFSIQDAEAVRSVESMEVLKTIATIHRDSKMRSAALERISGEEDLLRLANECTFDDTACDAMEKLSSREALLQVIDEGRNNAACGLAMKKLIRDPEISYERERAQSTLRIYQKGYSFDKDLLDDDAELDRMIGNFLKRRHSRIYDEFSILPIGKGKWDKY
jgi:hypothetical protein